MMRTTKLIIANSLIALLVVVTFASVLLNRFHAQDLRAEQENLERCMGTFRELLSPEGAPFGVEGGWLLAGGRPVDAGSPAADKVRLIFGGVAAVFLGDRQISGGPRDKQGQPAADAGLSAAAYRAVFKEGRAYRGAALISGHPHLVAYDPIRDRKGEVIGALFVGLRTSSFLEEFQDIKSVTVIMLVVLLAAMFAATRLLLKITGRFESAEANSLRLLRTLMDTIPSPIYYKDAAGRYLGFNKAYEAAVGLPQERMIGKTARDLWPEDLAEQYELQDRALRAGPGTQIYEGALLCADGSRHDVIFHKGSFLSEYGAVAGSVGVVFDITERKAAEQEIKNSNQRLHDIIDFLPDATFVVDGQGRVIAWNKAIEEMTGVQKEQMVGQGDYAYALPFYGERRPILIDLLDDDPEQVRADYPNLKREGRTLFIQALLPEIGGRAGRYIWGTAAPLFDNDGNRVGGIESMRDISDYKRVESELRLKNLLQSTQLESSIDGIVAVDENARIISYNRRFLEMFDLPQSLLDAGNDGAVLKAVMARAQRPQGYLEAVRKIYRHPRDTSRDEMHFKGGVVIDRYSAPMVDVDGRYYGRVWYFRDITAQRNAEDARLRFEAQRHHSQLMESFITQLGHDLRTPLTPLFALLPLIRKKMADPKLAAMIDICDQSVQTMHQLTERALKLVGLSVSTKGLLQQVKLAEEVDKYLLDNSACLEGNGLVCENGIDAKTRVMVVPDQLRELFNNLISNAARHSPAGGVIRISAQQEAGTVTVAVQDQGVGVQAADLEQIFDEFFKTDESRHDLGLPGLGLAICRRIIANHQGAIWAESAGKGCGLTVRFTLPRK